MGHATTTNLPVNASFGTLFRRRHGPSGAWLYRHKVFWLRKFRVKLRLDNPVAMVFGKEMAWPEVAESGRTGNRVFGRYRTIRKLRCTSTGMITDSVKPVEVIGQSTGALAQRN